MTIKSTTFKLLSLYFSVLLYGFFVCFTSVSADSLTYGRITDDFVNVREQSDINSSRIDQLSANEFVVILGESNDWYNVKLPDGKVGWIASWLVEKQIPYQSYIGSDTNVYSNPSTHSAITYSTSSSENVMINKWVNGWYHITSSSFQGWIYEGLSDSPELIEIVGDHVNVYEMASTRSVVIGGLTKGDSITIKQEINGWYWIESDDASGWIYSSHITEGSPVVKNVLNKKAIIKNDLQTVFDQPSSSSGSSFSLQKDTPVKVLYNIQNWFYIDSNQGQGWVYRGVLYSEITVLGPTVYIYPKPSVNIPKIGMFQKGNPLIIEQELNGWYFVSGGNTEGWVYSSHVYNGSPVIIPTYDQSIVLPETLNVYNKASTRSSTISSLKKDDIVKVHKEINGWCNISSGDITGWVYQGLLPIHQKVTSNGANLYNKPSTRQTIVNVLNKGTDFIIIREINGWYQIETKDYSGWVYSTHIDDNSNVTLNPVNKQAIISTESPTYMYDKPSTRQNIIYTIPGNSEVAVLGEINGWYLVDSAGKKGWTYKNIIFKEQITNAANVVIYEKPSTRENIETVLSSGVEFTVIEELNGWYKVKMNNMIGWIYHSHIETGTDLPIVKGISISDNITVTKDQGSNSTSIGVINKGMIIDIIREVEGYYYIKLNSQYGWAPSSSIILSERGNTSILGKTIVIDAGHGGHDSGAIGRYTRVFEKSLNLTTANLLAEKLRNHGANVILTRSTDVFLELSERATISKQNAADAFVSIHYNMNTSTLPNGIETYYYNQFVDKSLALVVQQNIINHTGFYDRDIKFGDFHVIRENSRPSILVELGFLSNMHDEYEVQTSNFQDNATDGIINGLISYFE
ncbi:SH3 domain-containing protein [Rossellomorea sp. SC111]|uniref:SH3 domain-containing protein n=1 Tax=Rossellomorea sp. SC111 TaxID=2968985 RepID=UPI00215A10D8|nr:SH3 domain-containing protein [Rossellomorea sp. SC111]MCR8850566.1 SH3 domain-containing protein [Rossellomorea sp. SC111]